VDLALIPGDELQAPAEDVPDALAGRLVLRPELKVLRAVVEPDAVQVVDVFAMAERSTKLLAHDEAVNRYHAVAMRVRMIFAAHKHVAGGVAPCVPLAGCGFTHGIAEVPPSAVV
jgi:hypothetical protein